MNQGEQSVEGKGFSAPVAVLEPQPGARNESDAAVFRPGRRDSTGVARQDLARGLRIEPDAVGGDADRNALEALRGFHRSGHPARGDDGHLVFDRTAAEQQTDAERTHRNAIEIAFQRK